MGVVVVALLRDGIGSGAPTLAKSCAKAAYALSADSVRPQGVLKWSATGPAEASVVFAIDVSAVPDAGSDDLLAGPIPLTGCERHGQFGVAAPSGEHVVSVFLVGPDGTTTTVGTSELTVDDR